jgi:hypothetical protein
MAFCSLNGHKILMYLRARPTNAHPCCERPRYARKVMQAYLKRAHAVHAYTCQVGFALESMATCQLPPVWPNRFLIDQQLYVK